MTHNLHPSSEPSFGTIRYNHADKSSRYKGEMLLGIETMRCQESSKASQQQHENRLPRVRHRTAPLEGTRSLKGLRRVRGKRASTRTFYNATRSCRQRAARPGKAERGQSRCRQGSGHAYSRISNSKPASSDNPLFDLVAGCKEETYDQDCRPVSRHCGHRLLFLTRNVVNHATS